MSAIVATMVVAPLASIAALTYVWLRPSHIGPDDRSHPNLAAWMLELPVPVPDSVLYYSDTFISEDGTTVGQGWMDVTLRFSPRNYRELETRAVAAGFLPASAYRVKAGYFKTSLPQRGLVRWQGSESENTCAVLDPDRRTLTVGYSKIGGRTW